MHLYTKGEGRQSFELLIIYHKRKGGGTTVMKEMGILVVCAYATWQRYCVFAFSTE